MARETQDEATAAPRPRPDHAAQPSASSGASPDKDRCLVLRAQDGAWRSLHLVREPAAFRGWLMRICTNKATSMARKRQRRATDAYDAEDLETASAMAETTSSSTADPAESSEVNAQIEALADLLASVQPELRIVWVLREVDDMSYEEIAQALNLTESTVRGRLARARSLVMRQMKEWA